jgi:hypothetical protein
VLRDSGSAVTLVGRGMPRGHTSTESRAAEWRARQERPAAGRQNRSTRWPIWAPGHRVLIGGPQGPWAAVLRLCPISDKSTRKRVVLLPHAQITLTEIRPDHRGAPEGPAP